MMDIASMMCSMNRNRASDDRRNATNARIAALEAAATRKDVEIKAWRSGQLRVSIYTHDETERFFKVYGPNWGIWDEYQTIDAAVDALMDEREEE